MVSKLEALGNNLLIWTKGHIVPGLDPNEWRKDDFGNLIRYQDYGNRSSAYGWEIDHIVAAARGGHDGISNLRPLRCQTNASLGGLLGAASTTNQLANTGGLLGALAKR